MDKNKFSRKFGWKSIAAGFIIIVSLLFTCLPFSNSILYKKEKIYTADSLYQIALDIRKNDHRKAISLLKKSIEYQPDYIMVHHILAQEYVRIGMVDSGIKEYGKVLEMDPENYKVSYEFGRVLFSIHRYSDAINLLETAITLNQNYTPAYELLARIFTVLGDYKSANKVYIHLNKMEKGNLR